MEALALALPRVLGLNAVLLPLLVVFERSDWSF